MNICNHILGLLGFFLNGVYPCHSTSTSKEPILQSLAKSLPFPNNNPGENWICINMKGYKDETKPLITVKNELINCTKENTNWIDTTKCDDGLNQKLSINIDEECHQPEKFLLAQFKACTEVKQDNDNLPSETTPNEEFPSNPSTPLNGESTTLSDQETTTMKPEESATQETSQKPPCVRMFTPCSTKCGIGFNRSLCNSSYHFCKTPCEPEQCIEEKQDYYTDETNIVIGLDNIESSGSCQSECQRYKECKYFTHIDGSKMCWLKKSIKRKTESDVGVTSGPKYCNESNNQKFAKICSEKNDISEQEQLKCEFVLENALNASDAIAQKVYSEILESNKNKNFAFSPFSLWANLNLILPATKENTRQEIRQFLKMDNHPDETVFDSFVEVSDTLNTSSVLKNANKIFIDANIELKETFKNTIEGYRAETGIISFDDPTYAANAINDWVQEATSNAIKEIVKPEDVGGQTAIVFVNALYLDVEWQRTFDRQWQGKFFNEDSEVLIRNLTFMKVTGKFATSEVPELEAEAIELPYKGDEFSMVILKPSQTLSALEDKLKNFRLSQIEFRSKSYYEVVLPRFNVTSEHRLQDVLKKLGVKNVFDSENANFNGLSNQGGLFVSTVVQKNIIEVNEEGTRAAAPSASVTVAKRFTPISKFDRPFFFFIRHIPTKMTIFMGRFVDPTKK